MKLWVARVDGWQKPWAKFQMGTKKRRAGKNTFKLVGALILAELS